VVIAKQTGVLISAKLGSVKVIGSGNGS